MSIPTSQQSITARLWSLIYGTWQGSPKRASVMTGRTTQEDKYLDIRDYSLTRDDLAAHLAGRKTYAATLGAAGSAWAGCKDYDSASEADILAALDQATQRCIIAVAFLLTDPAGGHTGGHLWTFYDRPYPVADIRAQIRTIRRAGRGEDFPSGNPIRLPFGYHRTKKKRGTLVFQDGRRFNLDIPAGLDAGIDALLALPRNGKPEPAPVGDARISGAAWGEAYNADAWQGLPDGGPIWRSPYIAAAARSRPDLAKLQRGDRVTLVKKDDTRDDSDSAQVAALAYNLLSADVCERQARAIADYLYTILRPGRTREHYRAHFDAELLRYRPKHYKPQVIRILGPADSATPPTLTEARHKPQPKSRARKDRPQKVAGAAGYLVWLQDEASGGVVLLSQQECATTIGCSVRTIKRYEQQLGKLVERAPYAGRQHGRLFLRGDNIPTQAIALVDSDVVIASAPAPQQDAENKPNAVRVEHSPPMALVPTLAEAVAEAFDAYAARPFITGKGGKPRRMPLCKRTIVAYITSNFETLTYTDDRLSRAIDQERIARQRLQRDACEAAKARKMSMADLQRKSRSLATQAAAIDRAWKEGADLPPILTFEVNGRTYQTRVPRHPTPAQAAVLRHLAGIYAAEEARRTPPDEPTMHELWAQVDKDTYAQARRELGIGGLRRSQGTGGSVPPPCGTVESPAIGSGEAQGLIARLKQLAIQLTTDPTKGQTMLSDARTTQALLDREEARRKAIPILGRADLNAAIAASQQPPHDHAAPIREELQKLLAHGHAVGYAAGRTVGQEEGIAAGITASRAVERSKR